jgi:hypothetical protein
VEGQIKRVFGKDARLVTAVFRAESGLRCHAVGDTSLTYEKNGTTYGASYGVAQIRHLPGRPTPEQLQDCLFNIRYAKQVFDKQGLQPWSAWKNGAYKRYLN